jgi:hypothetical protein
MTEQQWTDDIPAEIPRDRWKRPLITPAAGGSPIGYTRASTMGGYLDDTSGLDRWKQRGVAQGLALREELFLQVVSLGPEPDKLQQPNLHKLWKREMQQVCDRAREAAGASRKSTVGTALHALTDRIERGQDIGNVPESYRKHLESYRAATRGFTPVGIEQFVICDEVQAAGTFDRLYRLDGYPKLIIGDTKTGDISRALKIAVQLAIYAHGCFYDPATNTRTPVGDVDLDRGLIIALNADTGLCEPVWIDLRAGWEAAKVAAQVREARRIKGLTEPFTGNPATVLPVNPTPAEEQARDLTAEADAALLAGIRNAATSDELIALWGRAGNRWTDEHTRLAAARKAELLQQHRHLTAVK